MKMSLPHNLQLLNDCIFLPCGLQLANFVANQESVSYEACSFTLNEQHVQYRTAKITPTKSGQFVTIWKRNKNGITAPFEISDNLDFAIIATIKETLAGQFIFPAKVLADKGIITQNGKDGKRGIRVYPPWDEVTSNMAKKTKDWQIQYFLQIENKSIHQLNLAKQLFNNFQ